MGVIFNEVMARQTMMRGTVTVESLSATPWGTLAFTGLVWKDPEGREVAQCTKWESPRQYVGCE